MYNNDRLFLGKVCTMAKIKEKVDAMSLINNHINTGEFAKMYLLCGAEEYLVSQYKNKLVRALIDVEDTMNFGVFKGQNAKADAIIDFALTMPFFADRRVVLVEDSDFFKNGCQDIEEFLPNIPDTTVMVFVEHNIDARKAIYNRTKEHGVVAKFEAQDERSLAIWVKSLFIKKDLLDVEVQVEDVAVFRLIECVGTDMNRLYNEVTKLKSYALEKGIVTAEDVDALCINEVEGKVFDMMDALSRRDGRTTIALYSDLVKLREPSMRMLFNITRQFNILLKTKVAIESKVEGSKMASVLKVPPFTIKKYISMANAYTYEQLVAKVNKCQETDTNIKSGAMKDSLAVEMLIVELLNN